LKEKIKKAEIKEGGEKKRRELGWEGEEQEIEDGKTAIIKQSASIARSSY
jgi:hypothetical protein